MNFLFYFVLSILQFIEGPLTILVQMFIFYDAKNKWENKYQANRRGLSCPLI